VKRYEVTLSCPVATSFRATKAANSLDIDQAKKAVHHFAVDADLDAEFNVGLIVGASGSGKSTLAQAIYGEDCFRPMLSPESPVIDQFPSHYSYDQCAAMLAGVGLTSVPCWIRPAYTLSNGQRARAECALQMARFDESDSSVAVIDEWTSVVDRTVAKVMSHCIAKHARASGKRIVLLSCHYDVTDWLNADWIIDCNRQEFTDRRLLWRSFQRTERISFDLRQCDRRAWPYFSRYHYLSANLPGGFNRFFGLFNGNDQVGFIAFSNYVPHRPGSRMVVHANRIVIHPDYVGLGLGIAMTTEGAAIMVREGFDVRCKFSSEPVYRAMSKSPAWKIESVQRPTKIVCGGNIDRSPTGATGGGFRRDVKVYSFRYVGTKPCFAPRACAA
jgi:ABC-type Mn2+/Zn2+ transport system ATPase subunit